MAAFEMRPWGGFQTLEEGEGYKVKRLVIEPGHRLSLQRHRHRAEHWVVVEGSPRVWVGRARRRLRPRQWVTVPRGWWHRIENPGAVPTVIIEVQHGAYLGEDDILRRSDDYGRAGSGGPPGPGPGAVKGAGPDSRRGGSSASRYSRTRRASTPSGARSR